MEIAQVAPLHESVPPRLYGGTERVVSWLTEELVDAGHDVTLYATGDSQTRAKLRRVSERAGNACVDLAFKRYSETVGVDILRRSGDVEIVSLR